MDISLCKKADILDASTGSKHTSEDSYNRTPNLNLQPIDRAAERKLLRKCDLHVLSMIALLYSLAFLDRINIGNARIQGLEEDLKMKGQDYNIALFVFFIPYILFEVPSNIMIRKVAPSTWISSIMVLWGRSQSCLDLVVVAQCQTQVL